MTETNVEDKVTVFNFLIETGCCKRCALRFIGDINTNYDNPEDDIKKLTRRNEGEEHVFKRSKSNPCIICLDLLQDVTLQSMISSPELEKILEYDCDNFVNYISYPISVLIREHSMEIYVKEKFPHFFEEPFIVPINKVWSLSIYKKLGEKLGKNFDKNSHLQINFTMNYESENEEISVMYNVENKLKKLNGDNEALSRNVITECLKNINEDTFKKYVSIPPQAPTNATVLQQVSARYDAIFLAGRYCKYSRSVFQTPWVVDDAQVATTSVQEIIFQAIDNTFKCSNLIFSSSGREDFDVRTLGRGRPFFIKVGDPKLTKIPFEKFRSIEETIKNSNVVRVRDLQIIDKKYINNIKEGEQFKKKTYRALCVVTESADLASYIDKINNVGSITLQQKTPLRVYHRRSADVRERQIYAIKARAIAGRNNLFELDVVTQAGTYVKEFVHGDLGRTQPALSDIIGGKVDIVALDVLDIHLDFPPSLRQKIKSCA